IAWFHRGTFSNSARYANTSCGVRSTRTELLKFNAFSRPLSATSHADQPTMMPNTEVSGTRPAHRESVDAARLSPITNIDPSGTFTGSNRRDAQTSGRG